MPVALSGAGTTGARGLCTSVKPGLAAATRVSLRATARYALWPCTGPKGTTGRPLSYQRTRITNPSFGAGSGTTGTGGRQRRLIG